MQAHRQSRSDGVVAGDNAPPSIDTRCPRLAGTSCQPLCMDEMSLLLRSLPHEMCHRIFRDAVCHLPHEAARFSGSGMDSTAILPLPCFIPFAKFYELFDHLLRKLACRVINLTSGRECLIYRLLGHCHSLQSAY
jgi:hypothetical protein